MKLLRQAFRSVVRAALAGLILLAPFAAQAGPVINPYVFAARTFTFVGRATSSSSTIDISSTGRQAGDLGVLLDYGSNLNATGGSPTATVPSGHTSVSNIGPTGTSEGRSQISYKVLSGSEGSLTGMNGDFRNRKIYLVFRPSTVIGGVSFTAGNSVLSTDSNPANTAVDPSAETTAVIVVGQMASNGAISPRSTTPTMTEVAGSATEHYGHYLIYNTAPANQTTYDMDDEGNNNAVQVGYFTFN